MFMLNFVTCFAVSAQPSDTGASTESAIYINKVKEATLPRYTKKIGTTFENYFKNPNWKYLLSDKGEKIVEFTGDGIYNSKSVPVKIDISINTSDSTNGNTYNVSKFYIDNKIVGGLYTIAILEDMFVGLGNSQDSKNGSTTSHDLAIIMKGMEKAISDDGVGSSMEAQPYEATDPVSIIITLLICIALFVLLNNIFDIYYFGCAGIGTVLGGCLVAAHFIVLLIGGIIVAYWGWIVVGLLLLTSWGVKSSQNKKANRESSV